MASHILANGWHLTIQLNFGFIVFLYTDGVTEAMNQRQEFFFEKRLKESLFKSKDLDIKDIIRVLRKEIAVFAQDEPQSDDITMLILKYFA
jgi:phosphoserine phosphatase RsbU/P